MKKIFFTLLFLVFLFFMLFWFINHNLIASEEKIYDKYFSLIKNAWEYKTLISKVKKLEQEINEIFKNKENIIVKKIEEENHNKLIIEEVVNDNKIFHIKTPEKVKSLYFSAHSINNKEKLDNFLNIAKTKEINSIMIDLKEVDWYTSFYLDEKYFSKIKPVSTNRIKNIKELIDKLHKENIYVIARIAVFKDKRLAEARPDLAVKWSWDWSVWTDYKWYKYTDQYSKEVWNYHAELWIAAYELGFDEINYDYVRFPTDWYISKTYYPFANKIISKDYKWWKVKVIDKFANYITTKVRKYNENIVLSADVFWLVTDNTMFNICQNLESFLLSFDYVWPMVYPSHYWKWYYWYDYPDNNPYWVINRALNNAIKKIDKLNEEIKNAWIEWRNIKYNDSFVYNKQNLDIEKINIAKIRPYLQGFSCTRCKNYELYNREKFRSEVRAVNDVWIDSWWVRSSWSNYRIERYD